MTGILLLFVAVLWVAIAIGLSMFIARKIPSTLWGSLIGVLVFVLILPLPLVDEIVGKRQFEKLCRENSTIQVDRVKAVGKTVYLNSPPDEYVHGTWIPVQVQHWKYVDVKTEELVVSYNILHATGGRLIRALGISEGGAPLTFNGYCEPGGTFDQYKLFKELEITNDPHRRTENTNGEKK